MNWSRYAGRSIYLDANVFIYAIEQGNPFTATLKDLFLCIDDGTITAFTSAVTEAEVLVQPYRNRADDLIEQYSRVFAGGTALGAVAVSRPIVRLAARLRADLGQKLLDALHLATAIDRGCDVFLSNDARLVASCRPPMQGLLLADTLDG